MKILRNKLQPETSLKNSGCLLKEEVTTQIPTTYYHSRVSNDNYYWTQSRLDKKISRSQIKGHTVPIRYTDVFTYKKNYNTVTRCDFSHENK